jgi:hypothetical protein
MLKSHGKKLKKKHRNLANRDEHDRPILLTDIPDIEGVNRAGNKDFDYKTFLEDKKVPIFKADGTVLYPKDDAKFENGIYRTGKNGFLG